MKTKAEEALGAIRDVERREDSIAAHIEKLNAHIAQQDATIARMWEALAKIAEYEGDPLTPVRNSVKKSGIARAALTQETDHGA